MLFEFDSTDCPAVPSSDVCILGAGAAGIALATQLAAMGKSVVMLEGGGPHQEPRSQAIYDSEVTGHAHCGIHDGRFRTFGGSTTRWGGQILELQPIDFTERPWVSGSGWPIGKEELAEFYQRSLDFVGLRRVKLQDEQVWQQLGLEPNDLGPELASLFSRWLPERNVAELYGRTLRETRKLKVFFHASATGFEMNAAGDAINAVHVRGFSGKTARVTAGAFVVCLGGIESTRLLLQPSAGEAGLPWHQNGMVGRHYQDHLSVNGVAVTSLQDPKPWLRFGYTMAAGFRYHNKLWLKPTEQERLKTLNVAGTLGTFEVENLKRERALYTLRDMVRKRQWPGTLEALRVTPHAAMVALKRVEESVRGEAPRWKRVMLTVHSEQSPDGASAITLSGERDELGMLRTRLRWEISDAELHTIRSYVRVASEVFGRTGLGKIEVENSFFEDDGLLRSMCGDSYHHMGGTVMSRSAAEGVVDTDLRLHGVKNGYVCSSSVFPTSGFSNPTHTVLALAMRLADKLAGAAVREKVMAVAMPATLPQVTLPGSEMRTSQLGFGCAYLLGPGLDATTSRRVLDAAWDFGIRHFDVARLYGHGSTEALLGEFLAQHPEATVTTKFGVVPATTAWRAAAAAKRLVPGLGKVLPERNDRAVFRAKDARRALETSLSALRRERVELFLLHEASAEDLVHGDLPEFLQEQRAAGVIGEFGFGGEFARIPALLESHPGYLPVLQFEHSVVGPLIQTEGAWTAHYRTFAPLARALRSLFDREPQVLEQWSRTVDAELAEPEVISRLLLRASLECWPNSLTLFSTANEAHIFANASVAADASLREPAMRLARLLMDDDHGLALEMYGVMPQISRAVQA